jgi:hypothetical protein
VDKARARKEESSRIRHSPRVDSLMRNRCPRHSAGNFP